MKYTMEQLQSMNYYKELLPLYKQLMEQGKLKPDHSRKRVTMEKRIFQVVGVPYQTNNDLYMSRAELKACNEERERQSDYIAELERVVAKLNKLRSRASI